MLRVAQLSFLIVLFGQFGFGAVGYYTPIANPSWPFWIALYAATGVLALGQLARGRMELARADLWFAAFMGNVIVSFVLLGDGSGAEFTRRILLICIGPYLCGRLCGKYVHHSPWRGLQLLCFAYLAIVALEFVRNPGLLEGDRLRLYTPEDADGNQPGSIAFNLGITLGATWVTAFAFLAYRGGGALLRSPAGSRLRLMAIAAVVPLVLLLVGSRTSVISIVLTALVLLACAWWIATFRKVVWPLATIAVLIVFYGFLPEERKVLINELPGAVIAFQNYAASFTLCSLHEGSTLIRMVQLSEAWRLFSESPIIGVGAGNFGLRYCDQDVQFASPHSFFGHVLVEQGLLGGALLVLMLVTIVRSFLRQLRSVHGEHGRALWALFGIWVFVLIQSQFIGNMFYDYHVYLLTGVLVSWLQRGAVPAAARTSPPDPALSDHARHA